ncbi:ABC transporter permease [Clostridiales bacterium PH28_bin88]|nr:ABC transporter permease [Clostridiales bacterium PH28_bin88]
MQGLIKHNGLKFILMLLAVTFPFVVTSSYYLHLVIMSYLWAIAVYGLNLILGYTGQTSLGHAGFMGIGAYTTGLLSLKIGMSFWPALLLACLFTSFIGWLAGLVSLRTRGHYFSIFTLCLGVIIYVLINRWDELTGGMNGLIGIRPPDPIPFPVVGQIQFNSLPAMYYLILIFLMLTIFAVGRVVNSLIGRSFLAIKNSEGLAEVTGINVMQTKILSFVLSTFFAGLAGGLYAGYIRFIGPQLADVGTTFEMLLYMFVGGQASIAGPMIGSLIVPVLTETLQALQTYRMTIFGVTLILLIMFFPKGLVGGFQALSKKLGPRWDKYREAQNPKPEQVKGEVL